MNSKYAEAIQTYDKAIEIDPNMHPEWNNKGNALLDQGKYAETIQLTTKLSRSIHNMHLHEITKASLLRNLV